MYLPFSVRALVTGSVAMKTAPKQKPPSIICSYHEMGVMPAYLNSEAVMIPPANTLTIVFQLAIFVTNRIIAPIAIAITLVSPMLPGISPIIESESEAVGVFPKLTCANGVAAEYASGNLLPSPKIVSLAIQTASPDIFDGYEKNSVLSALR